MNLVYIEGTEYRLDDNELWDMPRMWTLDSAREIWTSDRVGTVLAPIPFDKQPDCPYQTRVAPLDPVSPKYKGGTTLPTPNGGYLFCAMDGQYLAFLDNYGFEVKRWTGFSFRGYHGPSLREAFGMIDKPINDILAELKLVKVQQGKWRWQADLI